MAGRPTKQGLEYFSLDVTIENDIKIEQLEGLFPEHGFTVYVKLLIRVYRDHGYFLICNDAFINVFSKRINVDRNTIIDIINASVKLGLFSQEKYISYSVLTSKAIQSRFLEMTRRRTYLFFINDFLLLSDKDFRNLTYADKKRFNENVYIGFYDDINTIIVDNNLINDYKLLAKNPISFSFLFFNNKTNKRGNETDENGKSEFSNDGSNLALLPAEVDTSEPDIPPDPRPPVTVTMQTTFDLVTWPVEQETLRSNVEWRSIIMRNFQIDEVLLEALLTDFFKELENKNDKKTAKMMYVHFTNWIKFQIKKTKNGTERNKFESTSTNQDASKKVSDTIDYSGKF